MTDNSTPMTRLEVAVEQLRRTRAQHAEKAANLALARRQLDIRAEEESAAAKAVLDAETAVQRAAKEVAG